MALLIECMLKCAPILIDNADIVRDDVMLTNTTVIRRYAGLVSGPQAIQYLEGVNRTV